MKDQPAVQASRTEAIGILSRSCRRLLLHPDDSEVRAVLSLMLATVPLAVAALAHQRRSAMWTFSVRTADGL